MPFTLRHHRRFPVQCLLTYNAGPFQGQGTVWNLSCTGGRESEARVAWEWQDTHVAPMLPERAPSEGWWRGGWPVSVLVEVAR